MLVVQAKRMEASTRTLTTPFSLLKRGLRINIWIALRRTTVALRLAGKSVKLELDAPPPSEEG